MPNLKTPEKRKEMEERLEKLWLRASEAKQPFIDVAEVARRVYADCPLNQLSPFSPRTHWNNYRTTVQMYRSKLSEGDPRVLLIRTNNDFPPEVAEQFQANLQALTIREQSTNIIQAVTNDVVQHMHGFVYVHPGPEWEWLSWFDVFVDNAVTDAKMLHTARYIIINRYYDAAQYIERRGVQKLRALGYEVNGPHEHSLPLTDKMPGRESVGLDYNVSLKNNLAESRTGYIKGNYGNPFDLGSDGGYNASGDKDGLICEREFILQDADSPSGWSRYYVYDNNIVDFDYLPEYHREPPIAHWAGDFLSGQFEQPALLLRVLPNQVAKTFVADKFMQHVSWLDNPTMVDLEENRNDPSPYTGAPGENLYEKTKDSKRFLEPPPFPNNYFDVNEVLKEEQQDNTGNYNVIQGKEPDEAKSGVAIARLQQNAETFFQLLLNARNEFFRDLARKSVVEMFINILETAESQMRAQYGAQIDQMDEEQAQELMNQFIPPMFQDLSADAVREDQLFGFKIIPPRTRDDKIEMFFNAIERAQALSMGNPLLAADIAGAITENPDIADELKELIQPYLAQMQQQAQQQEEEQTENEQKSRQGTTETSKQQLKQQGAGNNGR